MTVPDSSDFIPDSSIPESVDPDESQTNRARFCGRCGSPLDPEATGCPKCTPLLTAAISTTPKAGSLGDVTSCLFLYFSLLMVSIIIMATTLATGKEIGTDGLIVFDLIFSGIVIFWSIIRFSTIRSPLFSTGSLVWYPAAIGMAGGTFILASVCATWINFTFDFPEFVYSEGYGAGLQGLFWAILWIAIQPAIFEELAFRGIIQGSLERVIGSRQAILTCAAMFAILHLSVFSIPHLLIMGLILGWLRKVTGSLYPGMLMHFTHNALVVMAERMGDFYP